MLQDMCRQKGTVCMNRSQVTTVPEMRVGQLARDIWVVRMVWL